MSQENFPEKTGNSGFVKEIFERNNKNPDANRKISALFGGTRVNAASETKVFRKKSLQEFLPLGLDINEANLIRAVRLFEADGQLHLAGIAAKKYSRDFKEALKELSQEYDLKGEASVGISVREIQIRVLNLPPMPAAEIESAISWAMADALNIEARKMDEFCMDYAVLSEEGKQDKINPKEKKVLVAAVRKDFIAKKIQEVSEAGFSVLAVEPAPLALFAGLCYFSPPEGGNSTLLLDIGEDQSSLLVAFGQDVYLIQNVDMTSNAITQAVKDYFQIDYKDAENLTNKFGLQDWDLTPQPLSKIPQKMEIEKLTSLRPAVASRLEKLVVDIEHSYKLALNQLGNPAAGTLNRVIICGEGAKLKGIDAFIRGRFFTQNEKVSVEIFNPLESIMINGDVKDGLNAKEEGAAFAAAIGLTLRRKESDEKAKSGS